MDRNWNWQGWVAIALAGLALLVALGGRAPWGAQRQAAVWFSQDTTQAVPAAPAAPQAPQAPQAREFGRGQDGPGFMYGRGEFREFRSGPHGMMGRHGHPGIFGLFGMLFGLAKLAALGLLAWLLLRMFTQRRNNTPPAAPTTPAGHDPTVE